MPQKPGAILQIPQVVCGYLFYKNPNALKIRLTLPCSVLLNIFLAQRDFSFITQTTVYLK